MTDVPSAIPRQSAVGILLPVNQLFAALINKGTPGLIFLGLILALIWSPVFWVLFDLYKFTGSVAEFTTAKNDELARLGVGTYLAVLLGFGIAAVSLTYSCLLQLIPVMDAEAKHRQLAERFGGAILSSAGGLVIPVIDRRTARANTLKIMNALVLRARELGVVMLRANIFTLRVDEPSGKARLRILSGYAVNMSGATLGPDELTIAVPYGCLSSGRAFKYAEPVFSKKDGNVWPHMTDSEVVNEDLRAEVRKAHPDLNWIISMPIPYRVNPSPIVAGILNVDCVGPDVGSERFTEILKQLLADQSTAAALIGLLNRTAGVIDGLLGVAQEPTNTETEHLRKISLPPEQFNPADCPPPSQLFIDALGKMEGFAVLASATPEEIAQFLREQLRL